MTVDTTQDMPGTRWHTTPAIREGTYKLPLRMSYIDLEQGGR